MSDFQIPEPKNIDFLRWASVVTEELALYNIAIPVSEDAWAPWALRVCNVLNLEEEGLPSPVGFDNWRAWAERFFEIAQG